MSTTEILNQILLAGILGITGQLLRIIIGMKKLNEKAKEENQRTQDMIVTSKMVISILIGFLAGILAWLAASNAIMEKDFFSSKQIMMGIIAAGYSGTDFIEGIMSKFLPKNSGSPSQQPPAPPTNS